MGLTAGRRPAHETPIAFDLVRYGRVVGRIAICGLCFRDLGLQLPAADPLTAT